MVYLDWAASAPVYHEVAEILKDISLKNYANPSSPHVAGERAKELLENSRKIISSILGCGSGEIIFTSGATEANNMLLYSLLAQQSRGSNIVISGIEHPSVYEPAVQLEKLGINVRFVMPENSGLIEPEKLLKKLDNKTKIVSIIHINNEIGVIQPIKQLVEAVREAEKRFGRKILFHSDITQAAGKTKLNLRELGVDAATVSAHKFGGPRGVGALYLRENLKISFLYRGGEQEDGQRPGTENLPGIMGMARALKLRSETIDRDYDVAQKKIDWLLDNIIDSGLCSTVPQSRIRENRIFSPYILSISIEPLPGEVIVRSLSKRGILVSTGSACSTRKKDRLRTLKNIGIPENTARSTVRVSIGWSTTEEEIEELLEGIKKLADLIPEKNRNYIQRGKWKV